MPHIISFETSLFDPGNEPKNPINPIAGYSALAWLRTALASRLELTEPEAEDWGWYSMASVGGRRYRLGSCAVGAADDPLPLEWLIQIHKQRSIVEKVLGRNRMTPDDPVSALVQATFRNHTAFARVELRIE